jgi:hypothetical protein
MCVCEMYVAQLVLMPSLPDVEQESFVVVYPFQNWWHLVAIEGNYCDVGYLKQNFENLSCRCEVLYVLHMFSVSFWKCNMFSGPPWIYLNIFFFGT